MLKNKLIPLESDFYFSKNKVYNLTIDILIFLYKYIVFVFCIIFSSASYLSVLSMLDIQVYSLQRGIWQCLVNAIIFR